MLISSSYKKAFLVVVWLLPLKNLLQSMLVPPGRELGDRALYFAAQEHDKRASSATATASTTVVDFLSVGSNTRQEVFQAQTKTFATANTGYIRNVFRVTEDDDWDLSCRDGSITDQQGRQAKRFCIDRYLNSRNQSASSYVMRRNVQGGKVKIFQHNSAKWICAQKRFIIGLANVLRVYKVSQPLPDYLLLVDDDTWYNVDKLVETVLHTKDPNKPYVGAGCRSTWTKMEPQHVLYYGGMGLVLSRGSIERLMRPLKGLPTSGVGNNLLHNNGSTKSTDAIDSDDDWEKNVHNSLRENLIFEMEVFRPGMSLIELMDAYAKAEPFDNVDHWTRGFCFHSDNFMSYIIEHYRLHETPHMDVLVPGIWAEYDVLRNEGVCMFRQDKCPEDSLVCHYMSPQQMQERTDTTDVDVSDKDTDPPTSSPLTTTTSDAAIHLFLEHASTGGWSNQLKSLRKAYWIARATRRIFVMAPVLPHWTGIGSGLWLNNRFQKNHTISDKFKLDFALHKTYKNQVPLGRVLDLNYTFPNVTTMEYHTFRSDYFSKDGNMTHWVMESHYTHDNTTFTYQQPELENQTVPGFGPEMRYRDLSIIAHQQRDKQIWTFLDTYYSKIHSSVNMDQEFNLRFHQDIRQTAQTIQQLVWNNLPYASMHLRVGDGFAKKANATMKLALDQNKYHLEQWITNSTTASKDGTLPSQIGLFVATDMETTEQLQFTKTIQKQLQDLLASNNITMKVLYSSSFLNYTQQLKKSLRYPGIFLDQQLAACASIAFTGSQRSSFSGLIDMIRQSPRACDI